MAAKERVQTTGKKLIGPAIPTESLWHLDWIAEDGAHIASAWQLHAVTITGGKLILRSPNAKLTTYKEDPPQQAPVIATYRYKNTDGAWSDIEIHEDGTLGELKLYSQDYQEPQTLQQRALVYTRPVLPNDGKVFAYRLASVEDGTLVMHRKIQEESYPYGKIEEPCTPIPQSLLGETTMGGARENQPVSEMSLEKAKQVLSDVALAPETDQTIFSSYAGHEMIEIRESLLRVYADLVERQGFENVGSFRGVTKDGPGNTTAQLYLHNDSVSAICLELKSDNGSLVDMTFPYQGTMADYRNFLEGINVSYGNYGRERHYGRRQEEPSPKEMAQLMRGLRWMAANMLLWDLPGVILPKDLRDHALTIAASAQPALPEPSKAEREQTQQERIESYFERINAHLLSSEQPAILRALLAVLADMSTEVSALEKYAFETGKITPPGEALLSSLANTLESSEGEEIMRKVREEHGSQAPEFLEQMIRQELVDGIKIMHTKIFGTTI